MADVLLTHSYHLYFDRKQVRKMKPYPPLGTLYAAALLRNHGFSVALFDSMLENPEEQFREALRQHRPKIVAVYEDNFNFLSKMCLHRMREVSFRILEAAKEVRALALIHGSDATDHQTEYLERGFDAVLIGEAEWTLLEMVQLLLQDPTGRRDTIRGIAYQDSSTQQLVRTPPRHLIPDLDALPFPAWDLIDGDHYRDVWKRHHGFFSLNMVSSRGCPYPCNWCAKPIYGNSYNVRSPEEVAREMHYLKQLWAPDQLWFADDIFALRPHWTERFSQAVRTLDAVVPFKIQSRVDLMTPQVAKQLAEAGCLEVWMGAESGSQEILDAMQKGTKVRHILEACDNLGSVGIRRSLFLQLGYPGENWEDIQKTIDLVRDAQPDDIGVSVSYPLPGTKFYKMVMDELGPKTNWEDSEDLAMMFKGAYTSEFYQALHDALHFEVGLSRQIRQSPVSGHDLAGQGNRLSLETIPLATRHHLQGLWEKVADREKCCRNTNPTLVGVNAEWTCS